MAARMGVDIAPRANFGKPEMPDLWAFRAGRRPTTPSRNRADLTPGADGLDDGDGGANAAFDVEIGVIQDVGVLGGL